MCYRKGVLRNFVKFIGKHLCQSLFFNKVADLRPWSPFLALKNRCRDGGFRSNRPEVLCKKMCSLKIFTKFAGKRMRQGLFFAKVAGLRPANMSKKKLWHRCFPVNIAKFVRTPFFTEHLWALGSVFSRGIKGECWEEIG